MSDVEQRDLKSFHSAVTSGDVARVRQLLASPHVRAEINAPMFAFG